MTTETHGTRSIRITGGAGPAQAAAIAAVIDAVIQEERAATSGRRTNGNRLSDWVVATRLQPFMTPRR